MNIEPSDVAAIEARHETHTVDMLGNDECDECGHLWPCLTYHLAADLAEVNRKLAAVGAIVGLAQPKSVGITLFVRRLRAVLSDNPNDRWSALSEEVGHL